MKLNMNSMNVVLTVTCSLCFSFSLPIGVTTNYELDGGVGYLAFIEANLVFITICVIFIVLLGIVIGCGLRLIKKLNKKLMHILCISLEFRQYYAAGVDRDNNLITNIDFTDNVRRSDDDEIEMSNFPCQCKFKFQTESVQLQNADNLSEDISSSSSPSNSSQNEIRSDAVKEIENEIRQVENLLRILRADECFNTEDLKFGLPIKVEANARPEILPNGRKYDLVSQNKLQNEINMCEDMCPESTVQDVILKFQDNQLFCPLKTECQNINSYTGDNGRNEEEKLFRMDYKDNCSENAVSIEDPDNRTLPDNEYQTGTLENQEILVQAILSDEAQTYENLIRLEIGKSVPLDIREEPTINSKLTENNLSEAVPSVDQQLSSSRDETSKEPDCNSSNKTECLEKRKEEIHDSKSAEQNLSEPRSFDEELNFKKNKTAQFEPVFPNLREQIQDPKYLEHELRVERPSVEEQLSSKQNKASKFETNCTGRDEMNSFQNVELQIHDSKPVEQNLSEVRTSTEEQLSAERNASSKFQPSLTANDQTGGFQNVTDQILDIILVEQNCNEARPFMEEQFGSESNYLSKFESHCSANDDIGSMQNINEQILDSKPEEQKLNEARLSFEEQLGSDRIANSNWESDYTGNDNKASIVILEERILESRLIGQTFSETMPSADEKSGDRKGNTSNGTKNDEIEYLLNVKERFPYFEDVKQNLSGTRPSIDGQLSPARINTSKIEHDDADNDEIKCFQNLVDQSLASKVTQNISEAMPSAEKQMSYERKTSSCATNANDEMEYIRNAEARSINFEEAKQTSSEARPSIDEQFSSKRIESSKSSESGYTATDEIENVQNLEAQILDLKLITTNFIEPMPSAEDQLSSARNKSYKCTSNDEIEYFQNVDEQIQSFQEVEQNSSKSRPSAEEKLNSKRNKTLNMATNDEIEYNQNFEVQIPNFQEVEQNSSKSRPSAEEKLNSKRNNTLNMATNDEIQYNQNFEEQTPNFQEVEQNSSETRPTIEEKLNSKRNKTLNMATNYEIEYNQNFEEQIPNFDKVEQNSSKSRPSAEQLTYKRNTAETEPLCTGMHSDIECTQGLEEQILDSKLLQPILNLRDAKSTIAEQLSSKINKTSKSEPDFTANDKNDDASEQLEKQILDTKLAEKNIIKMRTSVQEQLSSTRNEALEFEPDCAKIKEFECLENVDEPIINSKLAEQNVSEARTPIDEQLQPARGNTAEYRAVCNGKDLIQCFGSLEDILDKKQAEKNLSRAKSFLDKQVCSKRNTTSKLEPNSTATNEIERSRSLEGKILEKKQAERNLSEATTSADEQLRERYKTSQLEPNCTAKVEMECFQNLEEEILDKKPMGKHLSGPKLPVDDKQFISKRNETSKLKPNCTATDEIECFRSLEGEFLKKKQAKKNLSKAKPSADEQLSSDRYKTSKLEPNCTANVEMECYQNLEEEILDKKQVDGTLRDVKTALEEQLSSERSKLEPNCTATDEIECFQSLDEEILDKKEVEEYLSDAKAALEEQLSSDRLKLETNCTLTKETERFRGLEEQTQDPKLVEENIIEKRQPVVEELISRENNISKLERNWTRNAFDDIQCLLNVENQILDSKDVEKDLSESRPPVDEKLSYKRNNTLRSETNEDLVCIEIIEEQVLGSNLANQNLSEARSSEKQTLDPKAVKSAASPSVQDQIDLVRNKNSIFEAECVGNDDIEYFQHLEEQILDSKIVEQDLSEMCSTVDEQLRANKKLTSKFESDFVANNDIEYIQKLEEQIIHDSKLVDQNFQPCVEDQTQHNVIRLNMVTVCQNEVESQQEFSETENVTRVENIYEVEIINRHLQQIINETTDNVNINNVNITNEYNVVESTNITTNENNTVIQRHETLEIQECISENVVNVTNLDTLTEISNNVHSTETYSAEQRNMYNNTTVRNSDSTFETTQDTKNIRETEIHVKSYIENRISKQEGNAQNLSEMINFYNSRDDVDFKETSNLQNNERRIVNSTQQVINSDGVTFQNKELLGDNDIKKQDDLHEIMVINNSGSNAVNTGECDSMKTDTKTKDLPISLERRPLDINISEDITKLANIGSERVTDEEIQTPFQEDNADGQENTKSRQHLTQRTKYDNKQNQNTYIEEKRIDEIVFDNFLSETSRTPKNKFENNSKETEEDTIKLQENSELKLTIHASEIKSTPAEDMHLEHRKEYSTLPVVDTNSTISEETNANPSSKKQPRKICLGLSHCSKRIKINLRTDNV